jgi:hypothetical protein
MRRDAKVSPPKAVASILIAPVVLLFALGWRLAYLNRLALTPLAGTLRGDEQSYWQWATYLAGHGFAGTNPFFQGPLYPYVLAGLLRWLRLSTGQVLVAQALWGAVAVALLTDAIRRIVGRPYALWLGIIVAVNTVWVFFDGLVLAESLLLFLESLLLWLWSLQHERGSGVLLSALSGLVIGLLAQGRATAVMFLLPQILLIRRVEQLRGRPWVRSAAVSLLMFVATVIPTTAWNYARTHTFMPFTYNGGINLFIGNSADADGTFSRVGGVTRLGTAHAAAPDGGVEFDGREYLLRSRGLALAPAQSSGYWTHEALTYVGAHPWQTLQRTGYKVLLLLNRVDVPQIEHLAIFRRLAGPVGAPIAGEFGLIAILGLFGVLFSTRWGALGLAARWYLITSILAITPFFVTDRYRVHLIPALTILAAMGAAVLIEAVRRRSSAVSWGLVLGGAGAVGLVWAPLHAVDSRYDEWLGVSDLGVRWLEAGRASEAVGAFEEALGIERRMAPEALSDPGISQDRAKLHFNYGVALRRSGMTDKALPEWETAASLDPTEALYARTLSDAYRLAGRTREADSLLAAARGLVGGRAQAAVSEGFRAARAGRLDEAERAFSAAVADDARLYSAWGALIRVQILKENPAAARGTLDRAINAGMPEVVAAVYEGLIAAKQGDSLASSRALARSEGAQLDPTLEYVKRWTHDLLAGKRR